MANSKDFIDFVMDQLQTIPNLTFKKMFGEYGIYADGKIFALACDDRLFIKPTEQGRVFIQDVVEAPPYEGAKPYFLIEDKLEDSEWLCQLARITVDALPMPKPKKKQ